MNRRGDERRYNWCFWSFRRDDNGRRVVEFYAERGLCVGNTYFSLQKYIRVARGQDEVEVKSMIDPVMVKRDIL